MQVRRPATNVTNLFLHFRICIPRTSHIKVFVSVYCHAALNFGWRAALSSVSFCSPTSPSVPTGSFQPSPNEFKFHYVKHEAIRPTSIQQSRGVCWHRAADRPYNSLAVSAATMLRTVHTTVSRCLLPPRPYIVSRCLLTPCCWPLSSYTDRSNLSSLSSDCNILHSTMVHVLWSFLYCIRHLIYVLWVQIFPFWILSVGRYKEVTLLLLRGVIIRPPYQILFSW
jgi:hypothetical protein